jgi:hypothetical protein
MQGTWMGAASVEVAGKVELDEDGVPNLPSGSR